MGYSKRDLLRRACGLCVQCGIYFTGGRRDCRFCAREREARTKARREGVGRRPRAPMRPAPILGQLRVLRTADAD